MAQKSPQLTQTQLRITREKKANNIAYWKRQEDEYFLSYFTTLYTLRYLLTFKQGLYSVTLRWYFV